jgi:hypothetical protein
MTENQIASILKIGFFLQYFTKESIQDWGRYKVGHNGGSAFFDLTFSHPQQGEIISILNKISGTGHDKVIKEYYFGFYRKMFQNNKHSTHLTEKEMFNFFELDMVEWSEEEAIFFVNLDADLSLRQDIIVEVPSIEYLSFLDNYTMFDQIQSALSAEAIPAPAFPS